MFMRFRGGGVGHLGTRYLNSRLKENNHDWVDEEQEGATLASRDEDNNPYAHEEGGDGTEEDAGTREERTSLGKPSNEEDKEDNDDDGDGDDEEDNDDDDEEEEDNDDDDDDDEDTDNEQEALGNIDGGQDIDGEDEEPEAVDDDEILDEEGFAEL